VIKILLIGDRSDSVIAHRAIPTALDLVSQKTSLLIRHDWLATDQIISADSVIAQNPDAIWCVPGSPYRSMEGALTAIRCAREAQIPFLGTCGGFQHSLIEYARNVLNLSAADHAESNPQTAAPLISKLSCALVNKSETIRIYPGTHLSKIYGESKAIEPYQCSYGFNSDFRKHFETAAMQFTTPLHFTAFSEELGVRAFELTDHPFFMGTLFQPERAALNNIAHPIVVAFVRAAADYSAIARNPTSP
jgi:CTP synthase (UTP-ammonia lyase)